MALNAVMKNPELYWKLLNKPLFEISGCKTIYTGINSPYLNGVKSGTANDVAAVCEYFKQVPFTWIMDPNSENRQNVADFGVEYVCDSHGMQFDLQLLPKVNENQLVIECVKNDRSLKDFLEVLMQAYEAEPAIYKQIFALFSQAGLDFPRQHLIGRDNGRAVSVCSLFFDEDNVASLFNVGTIPSDRNKGYASALVLKALAYAKDMNATHSALTAFEHAVSVYERIGYKTTQKFAFFIKN